LDETQRDLLTIECHSQGDDDLFVSEALAIEEK
jgi:hypothetical protein